MTVKLDFLHDTDEEFIDKGCRVRLKSSKCKSCKKYKQVNDKIGKLMKKKRKIPSKTIKLYNKVNKECDKCSSHKTTKCNTKQLNSYRKWYYGK